MPEPRRLESFAIPTSIHDRVVLTLPVPLTEAEWERMMAFLDFCKIALVKPDEPPPPPPTPEAPHAD